MNSLLKFFWNQINANQTNGSSITDFRYYKRWKKSLQTDASSVKDEQPWITFKTIDYLKNCLHTTATVFEYGGGGSSLFFLNRVKQLITVEHNKEWFEILTQLVAKKNHQNWIGNYIEAQSGDFIAHPDKANPDHYSSDDIPSKNKHYFNYASAIDAYPDAYFDVVLVDGRSRPSCIKHSLPKIKKDGILVLDNSDRTYYLPFFESQLKSDFNLIINSVGPSPYAQEFTKTSIWKKK